MDSLICDIDSTARHFQGLSFFWEALGLGLSIKNEPLRTLASYRAFFLVVFVTYATT